MKFKLKERIKTAWKGFMDPYVVEEAGQIVFDERLDQKVFFDFTESLRGGGRRIDGNIFIGGFNGDTESGPEENIIIGITPVQALKELELRPTNFSLVGLDQKINLLRKKKKFINQNRSNAHRELSSIIERLENRKRWEGDVKAFYGEFDTTGNREVRELLAKHTNLMLGETDLFIPEFPPDAIEIMDRYTKKTQEFFGKKPQFSLIADKKDFRNKNDDKDPILLAQSPFGFYFDILGAWGEELELLSDL